MGSQVYGFTGVRVEWVEWFGCDEFHRIKNVSHFENLHVIPGYIVEADSVHTLSFRQVILKNLEEKIDEFKVVTKSSKLAKFVSYLHH